MFQHPEDRFNVMNFVRKMPNDNFVTSDLDEMCGKGTCGMSMIYNKKKILKFCTELQYNN